MKDAIKRKQEMLEGNHARGVAELQALQQRVAESQRTILHIEGAIQLCRDLLKEEGDEVAAEQPTAEPAPLPEGYVNGSTDKPK